VQQERDISVSVKKVPMKGKGIVDTYVLKENGRKQTFGG
jgi:hypothetical protein